MEDPGEEMNGGETLEIVGQEILVTTDTEKDLALQGDNIDYEFMIIT